MTNPSPIPAVPEIIQPAGDRPYYHSLCWGAVLAGTVAAIGIHLLLTALGVGAGLATFTPMTDLNPVANFSVGAGIVWSVCAIVALWFGGLVAGRFSGCPHRGFAHGILVWSLTLILTLLLLSMGTGLILGGALKVLGGGLGIGGEPPAGLPSAGVGHRRRAFEFMTFASVADGSAAYTIALFQSNESFRSFEPSIQRTNCSRWRQG